MWKVVATIAILLLIFFVILIDRNFIKITKPSAPSINDHKQSFEIIAENLEVPWALAF